MLTFLLAMAEHPDVMAKAQAELDAVCPARLPTMADRKRLPYLDAVIRETLRVFAPAGRAAPRVYVSPLPRFPPLLARTLTTASSDAQSSKRHPPPPLPARPRVRRPLILGDPTVEGHDGRRGLPGGEREQEALGR